MDPKFLVFVLDMCEVCCEQLHKLLGYVHSVRASNRISRTMVNGRNFILSQMLGLL